MKIIGKNSLASIINAVLLVLFVFFAAHLLYFFIGFAISYYKIQTGSTIFHDTIKVGNVNAFGFEAKNSFQLFYPFTKQNFLFGNVNFETLILQGFGFSLFSFYLFCLFKIFKLLSCSTIFNEKILKWLSIFKYLNLAAVVLYVTFWGLIYRLVKPANYIMDSFPLILIFIFILFIESFFKKGYALQSENDLTI